MLRHKKELLAYQDTKGELALPEDFTIDIPPVGLVWLFKAGVTYDLIEHYGIGWSDKLGRVVMPVFKSDELQAVQSRAVFKGQTPKYWNTNKYSNVMFHSDTQTILDMDTILFDTIIITEDILSCIRVGRITPAVASLGTSLNTKMVTRLLSVYKRVYLWYDGDEAGVRGACKAIASLELQGGVVGTIVTIKDPKDYNNDEIVEILEEMLCPLIQ